MVEKIDVPKEQLSGHFGWLRTRHPKRTPPTLMLCGRCSFCSWCGSSGFSRQPLAFKRVFHVKSPIENGRISSARTSEYHAVYRQILNQPCETDMMHITWRGISSSNGSMVHLESRWVFVCHWPGSKAAWSPNAEAASAAATAPADVGLLETGVATNF